MGYLVFRFIVFCGLGLESFVGRVVGKVFCFCIEYCLVLVNDVVGCLL